MQTPKVALYKRTSVTILDRNLGGVHYTALLYFGDYITFTEKRGCDNNRRRYLEGFEKDGCGLFFTYEVLVNGQKQFFYGKRLFFLTRKSLLERFPSHTQAVIAISLGPLYVCKKKNSETVPAIGPRKSRFHTICESFNKQKVLRRRIARLVS